MSKETKTFYGNETEIEKLLEDLLCDYWKWEYKWDPIYNTSLTYDQNTISPEDVKNRWVRNCKERNKGNILAVIVELINRLNQAGFSVEPMSTEDKLVGISYVHIEDKPMELERFRAAVDDMKGRGIVFRKGYVA